MHLANQRPILFRLRIPDRVGRRLTLGLAPQQGDSIALLAVGGAGMVLAHKAA